MGVDVEAYRVRIGVWNGFKAIAQGKGMKRSWDESWLSAHDLIVNGIWFCICGCLCPWIVYALPGIITFLLSKSIEKDDARKVFSCLLYKLIIGGVELNPGPKIEHDDYSLISSSSDDTVHCTQEYISEVSKTILQEQQRPLARELGLTEQEIRHIEIEQSIFRQGSSEVPYQILTTWIQRQGIGATKAVLQNALRKIIGKEEPSSFYGISPKTAELIAGIQSSQRECFKDRELPRTSWLKKKHLPLDEYFIELTMKKKDKTGREVNETITTEQLFLKEEGTKHRLKILIEGHPGYGKTTLMLKILSDWSREETYVSSIFQLIFCIPLRQFKGRLESHFYRQCRKRTKSEEETIQIIQSIEEKVLLLLDGWDEASEETKTTLVPLLKGNLYPDITIVVTTRTGFYHFPPELSEDDEDFLNFMDGGGFEGQKIWEKRIQIRGISCEKRKEFLKKYLEMDPIELNKTIRRLPINLNDFYQCPLFLLLLGVLIEGKKSEGIETKTQLYKAIYNFNLHRSLEKKKKLNKEEEFNVFATSSNSDCSLYRKVSVSFGRLCLEKIKLQHLSFNPSEIIVDDFDVYDLGFLTKIVLFLEHEEQPHYEVIHKSFLEFFAAFYLSTIDEVTLTKELKDLFKRGIKPIRDQLIFQFLSGLLDSEAGRFFNALSTFKDHINLVETSQFVRRYTLEPILNEILNPNQEIFNSLTAFAPTKLDCHYNYFFSSYKYLEKWIGPVVNLTSQMDVTKILTLNMNNLAKVHFLNWMPKSFRIHKVTIVIDEMKSVAAMNGTIQCQKLIIGNCHLHLLDSPLYLLDILSKFRPEKIFLNLDCANSNKAFDNFCRLGKELISGDLKSVQVHHLAIAFENVSSFHSVSSMIVDLLKSKSVTFGMKLSFNNDDTSKIDEIIFKDFFNIIANSHIESFAFHKGSQVCCSMLSNVFFKRHRPWKYLQLTGRFRGIENINEIESTSVHHFNCMDFHSEGENYFQSLVKCNKAELCDHANKMFFSHIATENVDEIESTSNCHFHFRDFVLSHLLKNCNNIKKLSCSNFDGLDIDLLNGWEGFNTIETLELGLLTIDDRFLFVLSLFKNLRKIKIKYIIFYQSEEPVVDQLLQMVSSLPLLTTLSCNNRDILYKFLKRLSRLRNDENRIIHLEKLVFNGVQVNLSAVADSIAEYKWEISDGGIEFIDAQQKLLLKMRTELPTYLPTWLDSDELLDHLTIHMEVSDIMGDGREIQLQSIQMEHLFEGTYRNEPRRIVVEGLSKTVNRVFCCKLSREWAMQNFRRPVSSSLNRFFNMIFHLDIKDLNNGASIEELLIKNFPGKEICNSDIIIWISRMQSVSLLILENYDETNEEAKMALEPLFQRQLFPKIHVIMTCKLGNFLLTQMDKLTLESNEKLESYFNRRAVIKRFDPLSDDKWKRMATELKNTLITFDVKETKDIFDCPFFPLSLSIMIQKAKEITKQPKTPIYKNYFNYILKKFSDTECEINIFELPLYTSSIEEKCLQSLYRFGEFALQKMVTEESVSMTEDELILHSEDRNILRLGFLVKATASYEPIHSSFVEFLAAFSTFKVLREAGDGAFKTEIVRLVREGLLPTPNSLYYPFIAGLLNDKASLLFEALLPQSYWFNLEDSSFVNTLMEIADSRSFFDSFRHMLPSFVPPYYVIDKEFESLPIHSLLLDSALESGLIQLLQCNLSHLTSLNSNVPISHLQVNFDENFTEKIATGRENSLKCTILSVDFGRYMFHDWCHAVRLIQDINFEKLCLYCKEGDEVLYSLHRELTKGQWMEKRINRLDVDVTFQYDPNCLRLLTELVRKRKITDGISVCIDPSDISEKEKNSIEIDLQEFFHSIVQTEIISDVCIINKNQFLSPSLDFNFHGEKIIRFKSLYLDGSMTFVTSNINTKLSVEEAILLIQEDEEENSKFIQNLQGIKWLWCTAECFDSLTESSFQNLKELEELTVDFTESLQLNPSISNLTQLSVLILNFINIESIPTDCDLSFPRLFSSLPLRIFEIIGIPCENSSFDWLADSVMKALEETSNSISPLNELILAFACETDGSDCDSDYADDEFSETTCEDFGCNDSSGEDTWTEFNWNDLKESEGLKIIQRLLRTKLLRQFSLVVYDENFPLDLPQSLFPLDDGFTNKVVLHGSDHLHSRHSQREYRRLKISDKYCITHLNSEFN